jgi:hypothetical protein
MSGHEKFRESRRDAPSNGRALPEDIIYHARSDKYAADYFER